MTKMEKSDVHGCLGDAVASLRTVPRIYIEEDLKAVRGSDVHDNSTLSYGPDSDGHVYHICHSRIWSWFSHSCQATVIKSAGTSVEAPSSNTTYVYTIELSNGCWYVGTTASPDIRFSQHLKGKGSAWTKLHRPTKLWYDKLTPVHNTLAIRFEEDSVTKELMLEYGIDKVRGGSYCKTILSNDERRALTREIRHAQNLCLRCGRDSHWAGNCYAKRDVDGKACKSQ